MRTTKSLFIILGVLGLTLLPGTAAQAQTELRRGLAEVGPTFYCDAVAYASTQPDKSRVDVYVTRSGS